MMSNQSTQTNSGMSLGTELFVVFLVLKLTHTINWSWWWVTSPLWIGFALWLVIGLAVLAFGFIDYAVHRR